MNKRSSQRNCSGAGWGRRLADGLDCLPAKWRKTVKRNLLPGILLAGLVVGLLASSIGSGAQQQNSYVIVRVVNGDSVWQIAARYVAATEDIRDKIAAIRQANNLNSNAEIYPGQVLKVPVSDPVAGEDFAVAR